MTLQDPTDAQWYMDSGAISHLTLGAGNKFQTIFNSCIGKSLIIGNESRIPVSSSGS